MSNAFNIEYYPPMIPTAVTVGSIWTWKKPIGDYGALYNLFLYITPIRGGTTLTLSSTIISDYYVFSIPSSITVNYTSGEYTYAETIVEISTSNSFVLSTGTLTLRPNPSLATSLDNRSQARKTLDAIRATIEGRATSDQQAMSINGRSISRTPIGELLALETRYNILVQREEKAATMSLKSPNVIVRLR